jgi:PhnB protein
MKFNTYLIFNGCAEEALNFYKGLFDGNVEFVVRYAETPMSFPDGYGQKLCHARLAFAEAVLMMSDCMPGQEGIFGGAFGLSLNFIGENERARGLFAALAEGGAIKMPMAPQFWGAEFGMLRDRFGVNWMFNVQPAE